MAFLEATTRFLEVMIRFLEAITHFLEVMIRFLEAITHFLSPQTGNFLIEYKRLKLQTKYQFEVNDHELVERDSKMFPSTWPRIGHSKNKVLTSPEIEVRPVVMSAAVFSQNLCKSDLLESVTCYLMSSLTRPNLSASYGPRRELLDFWNGGANVLIWGLSFGASEIIWGLKFRGPKCAICGLKSGVGKIIWGLIFPVCHCPSHFLSIKFFSKLDS